MLNHFNPNLFLIHIEHIQSVPGGKVNILEGHSIGRLYEHVSYSERFPIFGAQYFVSGAQYFPSLQLQCANV
jgi:hypothetical protein